MSKWTENYVFRQCETRYFTKRIIPVYSSKLLRSYHARGILKSVVNLRLRDHSSFSLVSFFFFFRSLSSNLSPLRLIRLLRPKSTFSSSPLLSSFNIKTKLWSYVISVKGDPDRWLIASPYKVIVTHAKVKLECEAGYTSILTHLHINLRATRRSLRVVNTISIFFFPPFFYFLLSYNSRAKLCVNFSKISIRFDSYERIFLGRYFSPSKLNESRPFFQFGFILRSWFPILKSNF